MEHAERIFGVRTGYPLTIAFGYGIQATLFYVLAYRGYEQYHLFKNGSESIAENEFSFLFYAGIAVLMTGAAIFSIWQAFRPPYELEVKENRIKLRRCELESDRIKSIYVSWSDNPLIGIKPKGKWIVPNDFSFKFEEGEDQERQVRELLNWADLHGIPVIKRKAERWI